MNKFALIAIIAAVSGPTLAAPSAAGSPFLSFGMLIIFFVIFYLLILRPQSKRAKEHRNLVAAVKVGDEVVTSGGFAGKVKKVGEEFLVVELAEGTEVKLQRQAISATLVKGTLKDI